MLAMKLLLFIVPLLHNADAQMGKFSGEAATITAPPELSTPHMANSLDIARNVSAEFPLGVTISPPSTKYVPPNQSNVIQIDPTQTGQQGYNPSYWTQPISTVKPASQAIANPTTSYIPPCWTHPTAPTTPRPVYTTPRYTTHPPATHPTTPYVPPCWTHPTAPTTARPVYTTPRYTTHPPTTHPTTPYVPPCWTHPTAPTTPYVPPCWTHPTAPTTARPVYTTPRYTTHPPTTHPTTPYVPPCWTHPTAPTTVRPVYTTPRYTTHPPTTHPTTPYVPPCWTHPTAATTPRPVYTTPRYTTTHPTTPHVPPCWTATTPHYTQPPTVAPITAAPHNYYVCQERNHYYQIPTECNTYIECRDNAASKKMCPSGMIFKPDTVWPANPCVSSSEYKCTHGYILEKIPQNICPESE